MDDFKILNEPPVFIKGNHNYKRHLPEYFCGDPNDEGGFFVRPNFHNKGAVAGGHPHNMGHKTVAEHGSFFIEALDEDGTAWSQTIYARDSKLLKRLHRFTFRDFFYDYIRDYMLNKQFTHNIFSYWFHKKVYDSTWFRSYIPSDDEREDAPAWMWIKPKTIHQITSLEDNGHFNCLFSHRDAQGKITLVRTNLPGNDMKTYC